MTDTLVQGPRMVLSDGGSVLSRRSSSLASRASSESNKAQATHGPERQTSKHSSRTHTRDPSLTSFPSFPTDGDNYNTPSLTDSRKPNRTISQKFRDRKTTLAGLTNASSHAGRQNALFDDSPRSSLDIPGSLHLASDEHIERMIVKIGAVKLIRQYASDLAHRDSELSTVRVRADHRERELKRLLREADVPSAEVEKRLLRLERPELVTGEEDIDTHDKRRSVTSLDGLMTEAMSADLQMPSPEEISTISPLSEPSGQSLAANTLRRISSSIENNKGGTSSSRANSVISQHNQEADATVRPKAANSNNGRVTGLQSIFQPPAQSSSYFIGGNNKTIKPVKKTKAVDEISVKSNNSGRSFTSWTRIFGGAAQPSRSRASSLDQAAKPRSEDIDSAILSKTRTNPGGPRTTAVNSQRPRPTANRSNTHTVTRLSSSPSHVRKDSMSSSMPPTVEMDSMIESSQLPPTMTSYNPEGLLTDRFGFIYDRKRKRNQLLSQSSTKQRSITPLASLKSGDTSPEGNVVERPSTPVSIDDDMPKKSWQDYLTPTSGPSKGRPKELLSHTPSAGAVVTVNSIEATGTITPPRVRETSISVASQKPLPTVSHMTEPQSSAVTVMSTGFSHESENDADLAASRILLDQLTDLHDALQSERTVKWNDFLRRVRAERASTTERGANNAPEADLVNGELIGIATLGRSGKTKNKYMHFKTLVLSGIPVSLRPKIWAECSGATQMRIPGYYEDLVARCNEGSDIDSEIDHQIRADVKRTLRDNVFFRSPTGPGARRLEELLRAYSLHNPTIGYCQGMNLITASLLLICSMPEDCFWLLVAIIDHILPSGYFDQSLLVARADQIVLRQYVAEVLPKLDTKLHELGVELEACTFHWFLSLYSGVLTGGEALYRVWDVVLCLNSSDATPDSWTTHGRGLNVDMSALTGGLASPITSTVPKNPSQPGDLVDSLNSHDGTCSPFLFQLSLALLKLNENAILALESPAQVYTYLNHNMTAHNITIDALVAASEGLRSKVKRQDVLDRRKVAANTLI